MHRGRELTFASGPRSRRRADESESDRGGDALEERSPSVGMLGACCVGVVGMEMASIYSGEGDGWGEVLLSLSSSLMLYNAEAFYYPANHGWRVARDGLNNLCCVGWKRSAR